MAGEERISREAVLVKLLRRRKPIFPRPFREDILIRLEAIGVRLRDPEYFGDFVAARIMTRTLDLLVSLLVGK